MKKKREKKTLFGRLTFRRRLFLSFFAVNLLILIGTGTYFNYYYTHRAYIEMAGNVDTAVSRLSTDISHIAGTVVQVSDQLVEDSRVPMAMSAQSTRRDFNTQMEDFWILKGIVNTVYSNNVPIKATLYFGDDVVYTSVDERFRRLERAEGFGWYGEIDWQYGAIYWTDLYDLSEGAGEPQWVFGAARSMRGVSFGDASPGLLSVYFSEGDIQRLLEELEDRYGSQLVLVNHTGSVLVSTREEELGMQLAAVELFGELDYTAAAQYRQELDGDEYHVNTIPVPGSGWLLVALTPTGFLRGAGAGLWVVVFIVLTASLLMMVLDILLSRQLTGRVKRLLGQVHTPVRGDGIPVLTADKDFEEELESLTSAFSDITSKTRELEADLAEQSLARREARLSALQAQIDSHFLYNSLDVINWMALDIGAGDISRMVQLLSRYYRLSLSGGMEITTVHDEVEHVRSYLEIQKIRFEEKVDYSLVVQPGLGRLRVVKLILQPVVENAIVHGLMPMQAQSGKIDIGVKREGETLVFTIKNNGLPIPQEKLDAINSGVVARSTNVADPPRGSNVGLRNIRERLDLHYAGKASLHVESVAGHTEFTIVVPVMPDEI